jgi:hypothetical protein
MTCQARHLHNFPKLSFADGTRIYLEKACSAKTEDGNHLCRTCSFFQSPIHGLVTEKPPAHTHTYMSEWYDKKVLAVGPLSIRAQVYLKAAHDAAVKGDALPAFCHPKPAATSISKAMPPKKPVAARAAAQPPPPPSSPASGSSEAPPKLKRSGSASADSMLVTRRSGSASADSMLVTRRSATLTPDTQVQIVGKAPRARKAAVRRRSPVARLTDQSPPMVPLATDFRLSQEKAAIIKSSLQVFVPTICEADDEPLEITEVEYIKLEKVPEEEAIYMNPTTKQHYTYTMDEGIKAV